MTKLTSPQTGQRLAYDADGNLVAGYVSGDLNGDGSVGQADLGILIAALGTCEGDAGYIAAANLALNDPGPQCIDQADMGVLLSYYGLSATNTIRARFTWDAENRLVAWELLQFVDGAKKTQFAYDYQGRRIEKKVYTRSGSSWNLSQTRRFVWNDWLLLLELDDAGGAGFQPARKLTWGRDLGSVGVPAGNPLDGAGGIGGLMATSDPNDLNDPNDLFGEYVFLYDANGNVGHLIDLAEQGSGTAITAHYEYDPYGNPLLDVADPNQSGPYAAANPYRFSTKPWDDETGLGYWGERYYDPRLGRWMNRDPIEELAGENLYVYTGNDPASRIDSLGRLSLAPFWLCPLEDVLTGWKVCCSSVDTRRHGPLAGLVRHCDLREGPCAEGEIGYDVWLSGSCDRRMDNGTPCCRASVDDVAECLQRNRYSPRPPRP